MKFLGKVAVISGKEAAFLDGQGGETYKERFCLLQREWARRRRKDVSDDKVGEDRIDY